MKIGIYSFPEGKEPKDLKNEIKGLKRLLKECRRRFEVYKKTKPSREYIIYDLEYLTTEINEALR